MIHSKEVRMAETNADDPCDDWSDKPIPKTEKENESDKKVQPNSSTRQASFSLSGRVLFPIKQVPKSLRKDTKE